MSCACLLTLCLDVLCLQNVKHEDRDRRGTSIQAPVTSQISNNEYLQPAPVLDRSSDKTEKKERSSKSKEKREKQTDEERELRRERKLGRKRVRLSNQKHII